MNWNLYIQNLFFNFKNYFELNIIEKKEEFWSKYSIDYTYTYILNLVQVYKKMPLMESLILIDGLISAFVFLKEYIILKVAEKRLNSKRILDSKKDIILHYNKIYILDVYDRYLLYLCIFIIYSILNTYEIFYNNFINISVIFALPFIQNYILKLPLINKYLLLHIKNKEIFIKYSIAKVIVQFVEGLHLNIIKIQNYHIFLIYKYISFNYVWSITKTYLFILLLYTLRSYQSLYKYYKAIKLAYYYENSILFNVMPEEMAVDLVNMIIKEKRWDSLIKIEILNAFYVLISQKYKEETPLLINIQITLFKIFSIWSLVSLCKVLFFSIAVNYLYFMIFSYIIIMNSNKFKNIITGIIIYLLLLFNVNDIIITLVIISDKFIYYCLEEFYFFSLNAKNMRKMIKEYSETRRIDIKKEYCLIENKSEI
jgi:hypothetical protein